jgi:phosphatidylserine/phosphatidylglycerophosphate/cardiolipin synthase-like enzyme
MITALSNKIAEGIDVRIFYDENGCKRLKEKIQSANIFPVTSPGIMHKKVLIIDDTLVFLASANLTETSLRLHDNLVIGCYSK